MLEIKEGVTVVCLLGHMQAMFQQVALDPEKTCLIWGDVVFDDV
jgi:hypothetical protein